MGIDCFCFHISESIWLLSQLPFQSLNDVTLPNFLAQKFFNFSLVFIVKVWKFDILLLHFQWGFRWSELWLDLIDFHFVAIFLYLKLSLFFSQLFPHLLQLTFWALLPIISLLFHFNESIPENCIVFFKLSWSFFLLLELFKYLNLFKVFIATSISLRFEFLFN